MGNHGISTSHIPLPEELSTTVLNRKEFPLALDTVAARVAGMAVGTRTLEREQIFPASPDALWEIISNTEHLNRMVGLTAVRYSDPTTQQGTVFRWAESPMMRFWTLRWKEQPFEWVRPEFFRVRRLFSNGPLRELIFGVELEPVPLGCRVRVTMKAEPRNVLGRLGMTFTLPRILDDMLRYCTATLAQNAANPRNAGVERARGVAKSTTTSSSPTSAPQSIQTYATLNTSFYEEGLIRLFENTVPRPEPAAVQRLTRHLATGTDEQVLGMKPFALADEWGTDRRDTLVLFLHSTRAGLLELEWQLMCPNCRVPNVTYNSLASLEPTYHCGFCGVDYTSDLDQATELRFNIHPTLRKVTREVYCIGNPLSTPHILCQQQLAPGEVRRVSIMLPGGASTGERPSDEEEDVPLRLRVLQRNHSLVVRSAAIADSAEPEHSSGSSKSSLPPLHFSYDGTYWTGPENALQGWAPSAYVAPADAKVTLRLENRSEAPILIVLEKTAWDEQAATAAYITTMAEFRSFFGTEVLAPGREIAMRRICILFTDLKASTILYEQVGDAPAFGRVRRHFDFMSRHIVEKQGAVVKTMGDAVMAVFPQAANALAAALEIQNGIAAFNREHAYSPHVVVKIGVHEGPAIAVNANGLLDYFGRNVNLAARIQDQSMGGDVVCMPQIWEEAAGNMVLHSYNVTQEDFTAQLKGFAARVPLCRLRLDTGAEAPAR